MTLADLDLAEGVWIIPAANAKQKRVHRVFLPTQAVSILKYQRAMTEGNDDTAYVLPGVRHDRVMSEGTLKAALDLLGFAGEQTSHGFRASFKTIAHRELGIPRDVVELCLGHRLGDMTEQAYMRDTEDTYMAKERAAATQKYADVLDSLKAP